MLSRDLRLRTTNGQDWSGAVVNNFQQQLKFKLMTRERKHCQLLSSLAQQNCSTLSNKENKPQAIKPSLKMLAFLEAQADKHTSFKMNQSQSEFILRESLEPMRLSQRNRTVLSSLQPSQREQTSVSNHKPDQFKRVRAMQAHYQREKSQLVRTRRTQNRKKKHLTLPDQLACTSISPVSSQNMRINAILAREELFRQLQLYPKPTKARYNDIPITEFLYQTAQSHQGLQTKLERICRKQSRSLHSSLTEAKISDGVSNEKI